jgi:hypothetical protein
MRVFSLRRSIFFLVLSVCGRRGGLAGRAAEKFGNR